MKVIHKKKTYNIQWPEEFDRIIIKTAKKHACPSGYIKWINADADGDLRGLPKYLTYRDLSHRFSLLKCRDNEDYKKSKKEQYDKYRKGLKSGPTFDTRKFDLFRDIVPDDLKKKHGWKPKSLWTKKQKELLINLTKIYRKSKITIDWETLVLDPKVKKLPYQDRFKLMKYFGQCLNKKITKKQIKQKRADALRYKKENYKEYREGQTKRYKAIKNTINEFLLAQLPLR